MIRGDADREFIDMIAGRRIAVVGPARTLVERRQGPLIDSFDFVVRFNEAFEYLQSDGPLARDFGTRAEIIYANQALLRRRALETGERRRRFVQACERLGVRAIVCANNSLSYAANGCPTPTCPPIDRRVPEQLAALLDRAGLPTVVRVVSTPAEVLHRWLEGNWARTGFIGLFDILTLPVARVYLTGVTFYHDGGHIAADASAVMHPLRNRDGSPAQSADGVGHNSYLERDIMRVLARAFRSRLTVDEDLLKVLGYTTGPELWPAESPPSSVSSTTEPR